MNTQNLQYQKYCKHCKYLKTHKLYRHDVFNSKYFIKGAELSVPQCVDKYQVPINIQTVYNCLKKHFPQYNPKVREILGDPLDNTVKVIDGETDHESALDRFILEGDKLVRSGQMEISATNYISAINAKTNIQKNKGDRKMELIKEFFLGDGSGPQIPKKTS